MNVDLRYTPPSVPFTQTYTLLLGRQGIWTVYSSPFGPVDAGEVTPMSATVSLPAFPAGEATHVNAENIQYKVRGITAFGYASESGAVTINFVTP
jgi:hypothetical protein